MLFTLAGMGAISPDRSAGLIKYALFCWAELKRPPIGPHFALSVCTIPPRDFSPFSAL